MTPEEPGPSTDAERLHTLRRLVGGGVGVAVVLALLAGLAGAPGRTGAAIFLLVSAVTCGIAAAYGVVTAIRDELGDVTVSRRRVISVVGLFFAAAALMAMTAGAGG